MFIDLPKEICKGYDAVKDIILHAYDLVPEAYRQNLRKLESQTYVEYASEEERLLQRWLRSRHVQTFTDIKELIQLEEFKRSINIDIKPYLDEREVTTISKVALLVDNFSLTQ